MTSRRCVSSTKRWQSPPRIFLFRKKRFVFAGTATRIRRCLRNSPAEKIRPMEQLAAENPIPMYWVRPEQILSAEPGMHRFVWNLHHAPPDALEHEFPISAIYRDTPRYPL